MTYFDSRIIYPVGHKATDNSPVGLDDELKTLAIELQ